MPAETEEHKDITRGQKHWRNQMDREFSVPIIPPTMIWVLGIVFAIGAAYTFIMRIPAIEERQNCQALEMNTMKANYENIEKWMEKIDRKLERTNNVR